MTTIKELELIKTEILSDFPSGSSINYYNENLFLIGDDATSILILDKNYHKTKSIQIFDYPDERIPKSEKIDLEASVILDLQDRTYIIAFGSASKKIRKRVILIPISSLNFELPLSGLDAFDTKEFIERIELENISEVNIEGATSLHDSLLLANRGNRSMSKNHLIQTDKNFWLNQNGVSLLVTELLLPDTKELLGISELCYLEALDILFFTLSSEATDNAYDDGEIGDSYIGWISGYTKKTKTNTITADGILNLATIHQDFKNEKIEGICVESVKDNLCILHLVSDNDNGQSKLFKLICHFG